MYKNKVEIKMIVLRTRLNRRTRVIWTKSDANKCYLKEGKKKKKIKWQEKWKKIKENVTLSLRVWEKSSTQRSLKLPP